MATNLVVNGTSYAYPQTGDQIGWGDQATLWAQAVTSGMLQKAGGSFTLTADTNFGPNFGLVSAYFNSISNNIAGTGIVRLANTDAIAWRNAANSADLSLAVNSSDILNFNGSAISIGGVPVQSQLSVSDTSTIHHVLSSNTLSSNIIAGSVTDAHVSASAAIAYSKLALSGAVQNSDLAGSIAYSKLNLTGAVQNSDLAGSIAYSKLVLTSSIVNADISASAAIAYSKLALSGAIQNSDLAGSIAYSKLSLAGTIVNADISASAAIARSKIASGTANQVLINDGSGNLSSEATLAKSRGGSGQDNSSLTFPASGVLVTEAGTETFTNKTLTSPTLQTPITDVVATVDQVSTPSTPVGGHKVYTKSDGLYVLDTTGTETKLGAASGSLTVKSKTANYTILATDGLVVCDTSGGAFTATLPTASGNSGVIIRVVLKTAGSILTVASGGGNIGPVSSVVMGTAEDSITVCSDGTNWRIIELNIGMQIKYTAANGTATANAAFGYPTKVRDVLSWYNTGTGRFTPAYPGTYQINARIYTAGSQNVYIYVNGTIEAQGTDGSSSAPTTVSGLVYLNGSTDYCYIATDTVGATAGGTSLNNLTISRVGN